MTATNEMLSNIDVRYNYLIDSIPDVIGELDLDGTISFVSPQVYDMLGYHPDEMVGTNIIKFIHPDDVQVIRKAIKKAIKSKEFVFPNLRLKHKRGTYILVVAKGKLLKLKDKTRLIGVLRDVTKLNETEKKLEESQNIFKHLNEVFLKFKEDPLFNLQFLINTAGLLLKADCALFNILKSVNGNEVIQSLVTYKEPLNFTRESNAKGHICTDIIKDNPDDVVILSNLDKTDYRKTDENVREYDLKQYVSYVVRFNNKPTATFCVVYTENREMSINDITILQILSKSASTELARWNSRNELQRSEEKYRRLINNLTDIILELDIKGTVTYVSPQCYTIMGYQPAEIIGKKVMGFIHPDDVMLIAEVMKKAIQTNEVVNVPSYRLLHKNGDSIYATASGRYVNLGGIEKFIAAIRDDRKSKKLEKEILLARDNLINILSSMEDGVYIVDQNYDIEYVNPILTKEFDLNEGKKCYKYFHDREEICPWCKNQEVFKGKTVRWEWFSEKNQKTYDLLDTPLKNRDGSISKLEIFRDITERKKTEKELRVLNRITTAFLTIADDEIYGEILQIILDALESKYGVFGYINDKGDFVCPSMTRDLWKKCQMQDKTITFPRSSWGGMWGKAMLARKTIYANKTFILPEDHIQIQNVLDVPIIYHGELIGNVMIGNKEDDYDENDAKLLESIVNKITPILYNKLRIEKEEQKSKESEEKYRYFFDNSQVGLFWSRIADGTFLECNDTFAKLVGYNSREECLADYIAIEQYIDLKDRDEMLEKININGAVKNYEIQVLKEDGTPFWANISARINLKENRIEGAATDITERKKAENIIKNLAKFPAENPNPVLRVSKEFVLYANQAGKNIFQVTGGNRIPLALENYIRTAFNENKIMNPEIQLNSYIYSIFITPIEETEYANVYGMDITELKKTEQKLKESEESLKKINIELEKRIEERTIGLKKSERKFKSIFMDSPIGIELYDSNGKLMEVNNACFDIFGVSDSSEIEGFDLFSDPNIPIDEMEKLKNGKIIHYEAEFDFDKIKQLNLYETSKSGKSHLAVLITPLFIEGKQETSKYLVQIQDITKRNINENKLKEYAEKLEFMVEERTRRLEKVVEKLKISEEKLKEQNQFLNSVIESLTHPFIVINVKDYNVYLANTAASSKGVSQNLFCYNLNHERNKPCVDDCICPLNTIVRTKKEVSVEHTHYNQEGEAHIYEVHGYPILDKNDEVVQMIEYSLDITERKISEQKLRESEEKYRILIETAVMGLVEFDLEENKVSYINPKLLEILGYSKKDLLDENTFLKIIHPEDYKELVNTIDEGYIEFRIFAKDGKLKWLSGTRNNLFDQEGKITSTRLWLQDSTESKEVEEIKSNLLTRFSHEFKTPLISIKGFADFLLTVYKVNLDEKTLLFLKRIKDGSDRLQMLINSFVESSQLDKSIIQVNLRKENLYDLITEALNELEGLIYMREHEIDMNMDKQLITHLDKEKVYTVITNLLINAINYTPKGGIILIQSKIDKKSIVISIKDDGIGLDETERISLFKPFGKIERYGKGWDIVIGGMGMGLFISKEIIELHGGKIWVESEGRNKGSTFYFSIPITK